jgi:hypothetical protein
MSSAAIFGALIAIIYLIITITDDGQIMATKSKIAFELFGMYWAPFIGVSVAPIFGVVEKIIMLLLIAVIFAIVGALYYRAVNPKIPFVLPAKKEPTLRQKLGFSLYIIVECFSIGLAFSIGVLTWQYYSVNDVPVLTYSNFGAILLFIYGVIFVVDVVRKLRMGIFRFIESLDN